jgi:hypothetical protein
MLISATAYSRKVEVMDGLASKGNYRELAFGKANLGSFVRKGWITSVLKPNLCIAMLRHEVLHNSKAGQAGTMLL